MLSKRYFHHQFIDINPSKLARRQRFLRRMQYRANDRMDKKQSRKLLKRRATKSTLV
ncbi:MAG: hypothetical protein ABSB12_02415 [Candidatus Saccharimonadales bacterium]|jgi:hypothetical protein